MIVKNTTIKYYGFLLIFSTILPIFNVDDKFVLYSIFLFYGLRKQVERVMMRNAHFYR